MRGETRGVEGSRVELAKNRLILGQIYSIAPSPSIQTDHYAAVMKVVGIERLGSYEATIDYPIQMKTFDSHHNLIVFFLIFLDLAIGDCVYKWSLFLFTS